MSHTYLYFVIIPAVAAVLLPFIGKKGSRITDSLAILVFLWGFIASLMSISSQASIFPIANFAGLELFRGDAFSLLMILTIYLVGLLVVLYSAFSLEPDSKRGLFFSLVCLAAAGMSGVVTATDLFTVYIFVEVVAVCSFALIAFENNVESTEGAIKYFFLSAPASLFLICSIALMALHTGDTSFKTLADWLPQGGAYEPAIMIILGVLSCGFMIKSGLVPFHAWTPDAYQSAPSGISALLAGIITKVSGVYMLVRIAMIISLVAASKGSNMLCSALMFFGAVSILVGALAAMWQKDFKRMLAFSSISQVGYIVLAAGVATPLGIAAAIFHLFNHATFKTALFLNGGAIEKCAGTTNMNKLGGLENKMPWTSWTSVIAILSTAGIPPLSGFWSKLLIIVALWSAGFHGYAAFAVFASVLTLGYFLVMQKKVFFGKLQPELISVKEAPLGMLLPPIVMVAIMVAIGLYFPFIFRLLMDTTVRMPL